MTRRARFALLLLLLAACSAASAFASYKLFRFTPDDNWHNGFWDGYTACWYSPLRRDAS